MLIFNATLHSQADHLDDLKELGHELVTPAPLTIAPIATTADFADVELVAKGIVDVAVREHARGLLVGGLTSLTFAVITEAHKQGLATFEVVTERKRDANDRFVFNFGGLRRIG